MEENQPAVPQEQQVVQSPITPKKSNILLMVIGGIVLLGLGLLSGYFMFGNKNQITSQTPAQITTAAPTVIQQGPRPTINETSNWKTYTSSDGSFSLKYPSKFTIKVDDYPTSQETPKGLKNIWFYSPEEGKNRYSGFAFHEHIAVSKTLAQEYPQLSLKALIDNHGADEAANSEMSYYFRVGELFYDIDPIVQDSTGTDKIWNYNVLNTLQFKK